MAKATLTTEFPSSSTPTMSRQPPDKQARKGPTIIPCLVLTTSKGEIHCATPKECYRYYKQNRMALFGRIHRTQEKYRERIRELEAELASQRFQINHLLHFISEIGRGFEPTGRPVVKTVVGLRDGQNGNDFKDEEKRRRRRNRRLAQLRAAGAKIRAVISDGARAGGSNVSD
ncbi:hypothetical protein BJY01DRAFT_223881 [Aspergillus pseudoustus]|uniref:BZIP domain-containing protein n=1 Tax=Aspergillus pseudoustus TaxID=1810923 RepID=A0ABR4J5I8_9EURO